MRVSMILWLLPSLIHALSLSSSQSVITDSPPNDDQYVAITHHKHPDHKLRLRRQHSAAVTTKGSREPITKYCAGATDGYTGYLSTANNTKHFYFAYFESRSSPDKDPLVMWLNGGPGCSSMMGLFMELGPCRVNDHGNGTVSNEYSWTEAANVFFLDQPLGVGYSYDSTHAHAKGSFAASEDVYAFISLWYKAFPKSKEVPFSIAGESYGGHYIPIFANHILEENELALAEGRAQDLVPLESVMIGNGYFDPVHQATSAWDVTCTNVTGIGPVIGRHACKKMGLQLERCEKMWKACYQFPDDIICSDAENFCNKQIGEPYIRTGLNYYDISKPCTGGGLCYPLVNSISEYLNRNDVRAAFGVDEAAGRFEACSNSVGEDFDKAGDRNVPTTTFTTNILNKGLRVLIYVGTYDWICNFVGNERFLYALPWTYSYRYRHVSAYDQQTWAGGQWWEAENLRYARINGAGHMVPYDKPEVALNMFKSWLKKEPLQ